MFCVSFVTHINIDNALKLNNLSHANKIIFNSLFSGASFTRMAGRQSQKAGGGIDGETIATFEINLQKNLQNIREELLQGKKGSVCCSNHPAKRCLYPVAMVTGQARVQLLPLIK